MSVFVCKINYIFPKKTQIFSQAVDVNFKPGILLSSRQVPIFGQYTTNECGSTKANGPKGLVINTVKYDGFFIFIFVIILRAYNSG